MAELIWHESGKKFFQAGVDRGVLYPNTSEGVPWNGLISVEKGVSGGETDSHHYDGIKYIDTVKSENFQATLQAFTYPDEFSACEGRLVTPSGLVLGKQTRQTFGLSYRTRLGNDVDGSDHGYRIHLIYNATALPISRSHKSIGELIEPSTFQWTINAVPVIPGSPHRFPPRPLDPSVWWGGGDGDENWEIAVPISDDVPQNPALPLTGTGEWKQNTVTDAWWYFDDAVTYYWTNGDGIWYRFNNTTNEWRGLTKASGVNVWLPVDSSGFPVDPSEWPWPEGFAMFGWPMGPDGDTPVPGWRATPYIWVDSNKVDPSIMDDLEVCLYGTDPEGYSPLDDSYEIPGTPAFLPSLFDMANLLNGFDVTSGLGDLSIGQPQVYPFGEWTDPNTISSPNLSWTVPFEWSP